MASNHANAALVQAYLQSLSQSNSTQVTRDPVKNVFYDKNISFDHENIFGFLDGTGFAEDTINTVNIQNAATLYAIMVIGDEMSVFRVADAILKYVTLGQIDVESTGTATRLYNYMKLREQRTTPEERAMFYKQVFDVGEGQMMEGMVTNRSFSPLMESLLYYGKEYIDKYEVADDASKISQSAVRQVVRDLQHNLSRAASGMVKLYVPEMYAHLEDAIQIISAPEIKDQIGHGVGRDLWNVVEQVSMNEFGYYPNTSALRTIAAACRGILYKIAHYSDGSFDDNDFQDLITDIQAVYIVEHQMNEPDPQRKDSVQNRKRWRNGNGQMNGNGKMNGNGNGYAAPERMEEDWDF